MFQLSEYAQKELLTLARQSVRQFLLAGKKNIQNSVNPELQARLGAFVTLHNQRCLRGCIGMIGPASPLFETVQECAISAATLDSRFDSVSISELEEINIEISVLSTLVPVRDFAEIEVGVHGLIVSGQERRGLLLPQVATEHRWDRETFLQQTCRKAGLPLDAWQKGAKVMSFTAFVFSEK